jgi:hypothetical protein
MSESNSEQPIPQVKSKGEMVADTLKSGGLISVPLEGVGGHSPPVTFNNETKVFSIAGEPQEPGSAEEGGVALTIGQASFGRSHITRR